MVPLKYFPLRALKSSRIRISLYYDHKRISEEHERLVNADFISWTRSKLSWIFPMAQSPMRSEGARFSCQIRLLQEIKPLNLMKVLAETISPSSGLASPLPFRQSTAEVNKSTMMHVCCRGRRIFVGKNCCRSLISSSKIFFYRWNVDDFHVNACFQWYKTRSDCGLTFYNEILICATLQRCQIDLKSSSTVTIKICPCLLLRWKIAIL